MKKLINDHGRRRRGGPARLRGGPLRPRAGQPRPGVHRPRRRPREGQGRASLSGGGSGHEPMHGGFVGMGMLDAACPGEVFTSPTPDQMYEATKAVDGGAGVLHIVKNYTGDVLNFEMAADLARAEGIEVEAVVTDDDVAVQDSLYTAGRRGVGITVLAEKIVGAAAEEGRRPRRGRGDLPTGERAGAQHGHGADLLHGSRGRQAHVRARRGRDGDRDRDPRRAGARARAARAGARDRRDAGRTRSSTTCPSHPATRCSAFVNGMGGTPLLELYIVYNELRDDPRRARRRRSAAASSGRTSPRWRWPAARSRSSSWTTR